MDTSDSTVTAPPASTSYFSRPGGRIGATFPAYCDEETAGDVTRAFSLTTQTSHEAAQRRLAEVTGPVLVIMGEQDPRLRGPGGRSGLGRRHRWRAGSHNVRGHPQSQQPELTTSTVLSFLATAGLEVALQVSSAGPTPAAP